VTRTRCSPSFGQRGNERRSRRTLRGPRTSFARTATPVRAVFDASALVRATAAPDDSAAEAWVAALLSGDVEGIVPDLVFAETANAFRNYVRAGQLAHDDAGAKLHLIVELPLRVASLRSLADDALAKAVELGITLYDACYVVLAEAADATLVTADRRLARAVARAAVLPDVRP
jgi:predicted nucleic acid-binding protein